MINARAWWNSFRPKTLSAALVPVMVASAFVVAQGRPFSILISCLALLSAFSIQIATNLINDAIDFEKGADTETRLGPQRVTQSGYFSPTVVKRVGYLFFLLAVIFGIPLVYFGGWILVAIGLSSIFCGYIYTGGPYPLAYKGWGDLFVIVFFGIVAVGGVYFLQTGTYNFKVLLLGLQVGALSTVLIVINNLRDRQQDALVNKKTMAVRFGASFSRWEILLLFAFCFIAQLYWLKMGYTVASLLPFVLLPTVVKLVRSLFLHPESVIFNSFLTQAALIQTLFGFQISLGFLLDSMWHPL